MKSKLKKKLLSNAYEKKITSISVTAILLCYKQEVVFHYGSGNANPMNNVKLHRNIKEASGKENEVRFCFNNIDTAIYIFCFIPE